MLRRKVLHPLLFAAYPVLALLAHNIDWVRPQQALRALLISVAVALGLLLVMARLFRDWHRAALLVSLFIILFFAYGHLYETVKLGLGAEIGRHRYLAPLYLGAGAILAWWIWRRARRPEMATGILNLVALVALAFPLITLARWGYRSLTSAPEASAVTPRLSLPAGKRAPDVYFLIVDGYARQDTLQDVYSMDNTPFLTFLEEHGFFVARDARSNYAQTSLSVASALNMDYVDVLVADLGDTTPGRDTLWKLIQHSEVRRQLASLGYVTVAFSTGLAGTELTDADYYLTTGSGDGDLGSIGASPLESLVVQTSLLRLVSDGVSGLPQLPYDLHRNRILNTLDGLQALPQTNEPKFVFAHIIAPHPPFVFAADGSPITPAAPFTLRFEFDAGGTSSEEYIRGYRDQVKFINSQLEKVVLAILERSEVPPVIILAGDHGPDSNSGRLSYVQERMTILNAYHLPTGDAGLYASITPVNSFRVVFNEVFGGDYPLLDDRVLFSQYVTPFEFSDVTDSVVSP
jgi:Sulfatase